MTIYFVSRHKATIAWARSQHLEVTQWLTHLEDVDTLMPGDTVIGTLPINIVASLCEKGITYIHFSLQLPESMRGVELDLDQITKCQPRLTQYHAVKVDR
ncbi:CRISPR-associated protein Csx16 [Vibrio sp. WXL210]|uniref:CRISPR-associated protein Csx16 n=1 Tax=Vibrio sp. WXL210 TaxID=3450709 RepID=UPI003EC5B04B